MPILLPLGFTQKSKKIDSNAIFILDKINDIGDLESASFNVINSLNIIPENNYE